MKLFKKSIYALSLVSMMGLWSCSQEDVLQGVETTAKGRTVPVTLTVSRGDASTRTELKEDYTTGGLKDVWVSGDQLHVYNSEGKEVGQLTLTDGVDSPVGVFYGEIEAVEGENDFALWYYDDVDTNPNLSFGRDSGNDVLILDLRTQSFADVKALSKVDVLSKKVTLKVNGERTTVIKDEELVPYLTFARFSLKNLPDNTKGTLNIYNLSSEGTNSDGVYHNTLNTFKFNLKEGTNANKSSDKKDIVVTNVEAGKDVYVALVPGTDYGKTPTETDGVRLGFTFTATNGDVYKFGFELPTVLYAGKYYNSFLKNEGEETGTISGVEIPLEKVTPETFTWSITIDEGYEGGNKTVIKVDDQPDGYEYTLPSNPTRDGYVFDGWSCNGEKITGPKISLSKDNLELTLTATWKDDGNIKWVDLGLPSGNLWADRNLGSTTVVGSGYYVGWGDKTATMTTSDPSKYPMFSPWDKSGYTTHNNVDVDGSGYGYTVYIANIQKNYSYDTAWYKSEKSNYMPNPSDFTELYNNTTSEEVTIDGVKCLKLKSKKNSNYIVIPMAGVKSGNRLINNGEMFALWSASCMYIRHYWADGDDYDVATVFTNDPETYDIQVESANSYLAYSLKSYRSNIRPIKK